MSNPTQHAIEYTKKFETGTLAGLTVPCRITFGTRDAAVRFLATCNLFTGKKGSDVGTGARWTIGAVAVR